MPLRDSDAKKDFNAAYQQSVEKWQPFWSQAKKDIRFKLGDQWSESDKTRLKRQERDASVFNRCRRMSNLLSGFEIKNRLTMKINPIEGADRATVGQHSGAVQYVMRRAYKVLSDAFREGPVTTGLNLIELYMDYRTDPLHGDLAFHRWPYNQFLLDPYFTQLDLSDCDYLLTRDWLNLSQVKMLLPWAAKEVEKLSPVGRDQKFPDAPAAKDFKGKSLYRYDRFYRRDTKKVWLLIDKTTGATREFNGKKKEIETLFERLQTQMPVPVSDLMDAQEVDKGTVKLAVMIEDEVFYDDDEPNSLEDYPVVPLLGYFTPEIDDWALRLCGVIRDMRDPATESNRRRLKMLDILDTMITGLIVEQDALVDNADAFMRGPLTLFTRTGKAGAVQPIAAQNINSGIFESIQLMDKDQEEVPGGNETLMGLPSKDDAQEAWVMGKLRMQAGLTIFEPLMDNHRDSFLQLGTKALRMVIANYPPQKVQRILNKPPTPQFFDKDFAKYDCLAVPGLLTDSQRQMKYAQLIALSQMPQFQGKIPASVILEASDLELGDELIQGIKKQEQMQMQLMMAKTQQDMKAVEAETAQTAAGVDLKKAQAVKAMAEAMAKKAEVENMPVERMHQLMEMALRLDKEGGFGLEPSVKPEPQRMITKR